jgi:hypothetical protein
MKPLRLVGVENAVGEGLELVAAIVRYRAGAEGAMATYACRRVFTESRGYWRCQLTLQGGRCACAPRQTSRAGCWSSQRPRCGTAWSSVSPAHCATRPSKRPGHGAGGRAQAKRLSHRGRARAYWLSLAVEDVTSSYGNRDEARRRASSIKASPCPTSRGRVEWRAGAVARRSADGRVVGRQWQRGQPRGGRAGGAVMVGLSSRLCAACGPRNGLTLSWRGCNWPAAAISASRCAFAASCVPGIRSSSRQCSGRTTALHRAATLPQSPLDQSCVRHTEEKLPAAQPAMAVSQMRG